MNWLVSIIWKFISFWFLSKFGIFGRIAIGIIILNNLIKRAFTLFKYMNWLIK